MKFYRRLSGRNKGVVLLILSAFSFAIMNYFVSISGDLPATEKGFFRNFVAMVIAIGMIAKNGNIKEKITFSRRIAIPLTIRSILGTIGVVCNFYAVSHLVLADASLLNKMAPFFVIIFSFIILKEQVNKIQISIIIMAFVGCLFVIKPTFQNADLHATIIGFCSGLTAGISYALVRLCGERGANSYFMVLFFSTFSCLSLLPFLIYFYEPMAPYQLICLFLAGIGGAGGQFTITAAYFHAPAKEISIYDYSQIIFAGGIGFFLLGEIPDIYSLIGYVIIISAAYIMYRYNNSSLMLKTK